MERHHRHHSRHGKKGRRLTDWVVGTVAVLFFLFLAVEFLMPGMTGSEMGGDLDGEAVLSRHAGLEYDGIDVSHHQGTIDWAAVAQDTCVKFVYIKATEGYTHVDSLYERNFAAALKAGLNAGSYHYLTSTSTVEQQFKSFSRFADRRLQKLRPMIDVEEEGVKGWTKRELQDNVERFARMVKRHYGVYPVIYSYAKFYNRMLAPRFNGYHLFIARYSENEPVVEGEGQHNIWQHTDKGVIDGISVPVDLDVFANGTSLDDILIE